MTKNAKIVTTICVMLISIKVLFSQSLSTTSVNSDVFLITAKDTATTLKIPERLKTALPGSEFVKLVKNLDVKDREQAIVKEILSGNTPSFSRKLKPLKITKTVGGKKYELIFFTTYDYIAIGSDEDYIYIPMTPSTAQYLANEMNCSLPTKEIVDLIYNQADVQLNPQPIPPSDKMTTIPVFRQHTDSIQQQIRQMGIDRFADNIIAGHKKDIIISNKIYSTDRTYDRVVIYGWHLSKNNPIQPVHNGHNGLYADYSHGTRLIANVVLINGTPHLINDILKDENLSALLSNEGVILKPNYPESNF